MNKRFIYLSTTALLLIVVAVFVYKISEQNQPSGTAKTTTSNSTTETVQSGTESTSAGSYQEYSEEALAEATGTKLLFFHASWCPQCIALDASIKEAQLPNNVSIFKVDYDTNQALRRKYGVTIQTTVVRLQADGSEEAKFIPYDDPTWESVNNTLL